MKIKTSDLTGPALRYAVCLALGYVIKERGASVGSFWVERPGGSKGWLNFLADCQQVEFDTDWAQGGQIIDLENIHICPIFLNGSKATQAWIDGHAEHKFDGPTPLIAVTRCFVASRLGDEVDVPEELLEQQTAGPEAQTPQARREVQR